MNRPWIARAVVPLLAVAWVAAGGAGTAGAQEDLPPFDRVEEDWELVIDDPDLLADGPQITTSMSPKPGLTGRFVIMNLNYRSQPSFRAGGLEVVGYDGEQVVAVSTQHTARLATASETITWTQSLGLAGGVMSYAIKDGRSTTWGKFGQGSGANLSVSIPTPLATLANYRPETSVQFSGVGWQANRVRSMTLVRVRYYQGGQLVAVDETARAVPLGG